MNSRWAGAVVLLGSSFGIWAVVAHSGDRESETWLARPSRASCRRGLPSLRRTTNWLNSKPLKLADQKGKVVVVHFWTNGCINCIHNYPHYRAWAEKYKADHDLVIVGIHTAEFDAEKDLDRIKDQAAKNYLRFAIAVDNNGRTGRRGAIGIGLHLPCEQSRQHPLPLGGGTRRQRVQSHRSDRQTAGRVVSEEVAFMDDIPKIPEREITPPALYFNRRRFLRGGIAAGSAIATAALYRRFNPTTAIDVVPTAPVQLSTPKLPSRSSCRGARQRDDDARAQYPQLQQLL